MQNLDMSHMCFPTETFTIEKNHFNIYYLVDYSDRSD